MIERSLDLFSGSFYSGGGLAPSPLLTFSSNVVVTIRRQVVSKLALLVRIPMGGRYFQGIAAFIFHLHQKPASSHLIVSDTTAGEGVGRE